MDKNKDYYAILGVHPTAEIAVIEAAYKALAKRYHPDVSQDNPEEAHRRMQEINEAYEILSDKTKRKEYDDLKGSGTQEAEDFFRGEEDVEPEYDPLDEDWKVALEYFPELEEYLSKLRRISWKLGYAFKAYIVDSKDYEIGAKIYTQMYEEFIERYFGNNKSIVEFANSLIAINNKQALKELNKVVKVLDIDRSFKKAEDIITKIKIKYKIRQDDPIAKGKRKMGEKSERDNESDKLKNKTKPFFGYFVVVLLLVVGIVLYLLMANVEEEQFPEEELPVVEVPDPLPEPIFLSLESFVVKLKNGKNFFKTTIQLMISEPDAAAYLNVRMIEVKDIVLAELQDLSLEDLKQSKSREDLRQRLISSISQIFPNKPTWEDPEPIRKVLFEEFVVQ